MIDRFWLWIFNLIGWPKPKLKWNKEVRPLPGSTCGRTFKPMKLQIGKEFTTVCKYDQPYLWEVVPVEQLSLDHTKSELIGYSVRWFDKSDQGWYVVASYFESEWCPVEACKDLAIAKAKHLTNAGLFPINIPGGMFIS